MLWLVAPIVASSASVALLSGCAKGRDDGKKGGPKSTKAAASARSQKKSASSKKGGASKRSARSIKSAKNPSAKANLNKPPKAPLDKKKNASNRSARSASKSNKSKRSGSEKKPVSKKLAPKAPLDKTKDSTLSAPVPVGVCAVAEKKSGAKKLAPPAPVDKTQASTLSASVPVEAGAQSKTAPTLPANIDVAGIEKELLPQTIQPAPTTKIEAVSLDGGARKDLRLEPAELRWNPAGGIQNVSIANCGTARKAIKVKCSDNTLYRVNPVLTIIEPGATARVDILRQNGAAKHDKLVFVAADIPSNSTDVRGALVKAGDNSEMMVLPLLATAV